MVSLAHATGTPQPPIGANSAQLSKMVQCGTCGLILYGPDAGRQCMRRRGADIALCFRCYRSQCRKLLRRHPDERMPAYRPANRHLRTVYPLPDGMFSDDEILTPGVLRVYRELYLRGADQSWVAAPLAELAEALSYTRYHIHTAVERLAPEYIEVRREQHAKRGVPAFRIVRPL